MALIKCRECGKDITENADKCPHCGHPVSSRPQRYSQFYKPSEPPNQPTASREPEYNPPPSWYQEPYKRRPARRTSALGVFALMLSLLSCTLSVMAVIMVQNLSDNITKDVVNYMEPYTKAVQEITKADSRTDDETETEKELSASRNQASPQSEYLIGETWTVDGQWTLTIDSITETKDRNEYYDKTPTQVFLIDFTYENLGYQDKKGLMDGLFFDLSSGQIVDSKGFMGYSYPGDIINQAKETPVGAKCKAQECIGVDNESTEIKIILSKYDGTGTSQEAAFILPIPKEQAFIKESEEEEDGLEEESEEADDDGDNDETGEEDGVQGIEARNKSDISLSDFSYKLSGNRIILENYSGDNEKLDILSSYDIDGENYETDMSDFKIGSENQHLKTLILEEGITDVNISLFDSCSIQTVFFPKSINIVYDRTLSYLHPDEDETIKVYYGGTKDDWLNIFTKYKEESTQDADFEEKAGASLSGETGTASNTANTDRTDEANKTDGNKYDSSLFEYFFSSNPEDLK